MKALVQLIRDMATYIEKVPDVNGAAGPLQQNELLSRFGEIRKVVGL
jgi:hypothetical protein